MRKASLVIVLASLALASVGIVSAGVNQYRPLDLDHQSLGLIRPHDTARTGFFPVRGWGFSNGATITARSGVAVTVSVTISGGPAEFQVITETGPDFQQATMRPRLVRFEAGPEPESFSFTWVSGATGQHSTVNLFWRSPTGAEVTLHGGSVVILYAAG